MKVVHKHFSGHSVEWVTVFTLCTSCLLISCDRQNSTKTSAPPVLQSITVSPKTSTIEQDDDQQFTAMGNYSDGSTKPLKDVVWTLSNTKAVGNSTGFVHSMDIGYVVVTATSGAIAGDAELKIERKITTEGDIPADFTVAHAMKTLYGNFDAETKSSSAGLPAVTDEYYSSLSLDKKNETYPFFIGQVNDSGVTKIFLCTYASALGPSHASPALVGMAVFVHSTGGWVLESSTKTAIFDGEWGKPGIPHIIRIGPSHFGVQLETSSTHQGSGTLYVSILIPWDDDVRRGFGDITAEGGGGACDEENGSTLPCVAYNTKMDFVGGANPDYYDLVLTRSGTKLDDGSPGKVVEVSGTERRTFSDGKYVPDVPKH